MDEAQQDYFLAEWLLDGYVDGKGKAEYGWALSAVQKIFPRLRLKVAWRVFDAWGQLHPPTQAPAVPPEVIHGMIAIALSLNRPALAGMMVACYAGLLRAREALNLLRRDVLIQSDGIVLCLGRTKQGTEQRVILRNATVIHFLQCYSNGCPRMADEPFFPLSYSSALRWVKKLSQLLDCMGAPVTTHTFRRSGASELARLGTPLADILLFGRWNTQRRAREYIRKGEVAIYRARQSMQIATQQRVETWARLSNRSWQLFDRLHQQGQPVVCLRRVTKEAFAEFEKLIFQL